jgi:hypothetical protein
MFEDSIRKLQEKWKDFEEKNKLLKFLSSNIYQITLFLSLFSAISIIAYTIIFHEISTGYKIYLNAAQSFISGNDPYSSTLGNLSDPKLNFVYPPITIWLFVGFLWVSKATSLLASHYIIYTGIIAFSGYLLYRASENPEPKYLLAILMGGFASNYWSYMKGNIDILSLLVTSLLLYGITRNKDEITTSVAGALSIFKFVPLAPIGLYIFRKGQLKEKIKPIITGIGGFSILMLSNLLVFPELSKSYIQQFIDKKGGNILYYWLTGNPGGESIMSIFGTLIPKTSISQTIIAAIFFLWILFIATVMISYFTKTEDFGKIMSFGILSYLLVFPKELHASTLTLGVPALYYLSKDYEDKGKVLTLGVTVILPVATVMARGKILPIPETSSLYPATYLIMHTIKLSLLSFWLIEVKRRNCGIPEIEEVKNLLKG